MRYFKFARRLWQGFCALVRVVQGYRAFTWLRDHYDIF
jgi:hypothetical protein